MQTWSLADANAALPEVRRMLASAREAVTALRFEQEQLEDLKIVYGAGVEAEANPGNGEWRVHATRHRQAAERWRAATKVFEDRGIELKDIDSGLIDFFAMRGNEVVFLCWKEGETAVRTWHTLEGGFSGRKPIGATLDWHRA